MKSPDTYIHVYVYVFTFTYDKGTENSGLLNYGVGECEFPYWKLAESKKSVKKT